MQDEAVANRGSGVRLIGAMTIDFGGGLDGIRRFRPSQPLSLASVKGQKPVKAPLYEDSVITPKDMKVQSVLPDFKNPKNDPCCRSFLSAYLCIVSASL